MSTRNEAPQIAGMRAYDFTKGRQPCANYKPQREGNGYGSWNNVHECFGPFGEAAMLWQSFFLRELQ